MKTYPESEETMCSGTDECAGRRQFLSAPFLFVALLALLAPRATLWAQAPVPKTYFACYVPLAGTVYRIKEPGLPDKCFGPSSGSLMHVQFSWTDGAGALRAGDAAGGDLAGTFPNPIVAKLQSTAVSATAPTTGQVLSFDGATWSPAAAAAGGVTDHGGLTGLTDDDHTQYLLASGLRALAGNLSAGGFKLTNLAAGTANGDAVPYEQAVKTGDAAGGDLAGTFPNATVAKLQGSAVSAAAPAAGQVLAFDGTTWTPTAPPAGGASGTSASTPNTLVQRDGLGGFAAGALTLAGKIDQTSDDGFVAQGTFNSGSIPATGAGTRMMWYPGKAAFRAGSALGNQWDDGSVGQYSVAVGLNTTASGLASVAMGARTSASGPSAFAMGDGAVASGDGAVSMGFFTVASRGESFAQGNQTTADLNAVAMGSHATATNGSFVFGDRTIPSFDPNTGVIGRTSNTASNQFVVRASGGFRFRTSTDLSTGCDLPAGSGVWACTSSRDVKTAFSPLDGEELLRDVASVPVTTWRYRTENPAVRHLGPVAQDFRAAFGLGIDDTSIGLLDISGVTFAGVQALEKRTAELRAALRELEALRAEVAALRDEAAASKAGRAELARRLTALEAAARK